MRSLGFETQCEARAARDGKRVRRMRFAARSALPVSAACVVANGIRETLGALLGAPVAVRLFEPCIPSPEAWTVILHQARLYRVHGNVADAAIVLRAPDAITLAAMLFGESVGDGSLERPLSRIECDVLDRMVGAITGILAAVCGARDGLCAERVAAIRGFVTYFELLVVEPIAARLGIALSRDPAPEAGCILEVGHLAGVDLCASASLDLGTTDLGSVSRLVVGSVVPIAPAQLQRCTLMADGQRLARGSCGVRRGRYALVVGA
jgi:hypothetical protein